MTKIRNFEQPSAQGDLRIDRVSDEPGDVPEAFVEVPPENGQHIVAHSETGHHHTLVAAGVSLAREPGNPWIAYLSVEVPHADLVHLRGHDTHETIRFPRGTYVLRRQREYTPEGFRMVQD